MNTVLEGRMTVLKPFSKKFLPVLYEWRNSSEYKSFCSNRKSNIDYAAFCDELSSDLNTDRTDQFIIFQQKNNIPIGTIYMYGLNSIHLNGFITIYITSRWIKKGYGIEAFCVFAAFIIGKYKLHKIMADVYADNNPVPKFLKSAGFVLEGHFKEHRLSEIKEWKDVLRFSLFEKNFKNIYKFLNSFRIISTS